MRIQELTWDLVPDCAVLAFIGRRKSGKTTMILETLYRKRHAFTFGLVFCGSKATAAQYANVIPSSFIYDEFRPDVLRSVYDKQERDVELGRAQNIFVLLDDLGFASKTFANDETIKRIMMNGRHARVFFCISTQYALTLPPALRGQIDVTFLCKERNPHNRERLYDAFNPSFGSFAQFDRCMESCTQNYETFVLLNCHNEGDAPEDSCRFYKATPDRRFRVNAKGTWWKFHVQRYDPQHFMRDAPGTLDMTKAGQQASRARTKAAAAAAAEDEIVKVHNPVPAPRPRKPKPRPAVPVPSAAAAAAGPPGSASSRLRAQLVAGPLRAARPQSAPGRGLAVRRHFSRPPATTQTPRGAEWLRRQREQNVGRRSGGLSRAGGAGGGHPPSAVRVVDANVRYIPR